MLSSGKCSDLDHLLLKSKQLNYSDNVFQEPEKCERDPVKLLGVAESRSEHEYAEDVAKNSDDLGSLLVALDE